MAKNGNTEIKRTIFTADKEAQYDEKAKQILGQKYILAYILANTVKEFHGMAPDEVLPYIEGNPYTGMIPVEPGLTNDRKNEYGNKIHGFNTENIELNEGEICFDILFYAWARNGRSKIIIDIEAQKDEPSGYGILNRAVFYVSREISSQKNREFSNSEYDHIKQVYSIWICMNQKENTLGWYHLVKDDLIGTNEWKGRDDLLNIVMIGLSGNIPEQKDGKVLHRLLGILFSSKMEAEEKIRILEAEYKIPMEEMRKDVVEMCNLGQGIKEEGIRIGEERGRKIGEEYAEYERKRANELERKNAWLLEQLAAMGLQYNRKAPD